MSPLRVLCRLPFIVSILLCFAGSALAQSIGQMATADPSGMYRKIKAAAKLEYGSFAVSLNRENSRQTGESLPMMRLPCDVSWGDPNNRALGRLQSLAYLVVTFYEWLELYGFDKLAVLSAIERLENASIQSITARQHWLDDSAVELTNTPADRFVSEVNRARKTNLAPKLNRGWYGCGAGDVPLRLSTAPAGGRIYLNEVFNFRVCETTQAGLGEDLDRCSGWQVAPAEGMSVLAGKFRYKIVWPSEPPTKSKSIDFSRYEGRASLTLGR